MCILLALGEILKLKPCKYNNVHIKKKKTCRCAKYKLGQCVYIRVWKTTM